LGQEFHITWNWGLTCVKWLLLLFVAMRGKKKRIFCDFRFYFLIEKKSRRKLVQIWEYSVIDA